jgi:hypothetical protein
MNKIFKHILYIAGIAAVLFTAGCKDELVEITELEVSRLFSPTDIEAMIVNQTSIRLSWKPVKNAEHYKVEIFENAVQDQEASLDDLEPTFDGELVRELTGVSIDDLPLTIPGFAGETFYSIRVKAFGEQIDESKWTAIVTKTRPEQIFFPVALEDITNTGVTLRWPAGEPATKVVITPGDITRTLLGSEIQNGVVVIDGLDGETEYTAKLIYNDKTRGTAVFTTYIDISNAIVVRPTDDIVSLLEAATANQRFAVMPGEYNVASSILIPATVEIIGALPYDRPVINGAVIRLNAGAGLRLKDLILDGTTSDGNQTVVYNEVIAAGETYGDLLVEDCIIRHYTKGIVYGSNAVLVESVTYKGNIIHNVICDGGDFIDFRSGMPKKFDFINNTVYNSANNRDLFRLDNAVTFSEDHHVVITIENNTFYNIISTEGTTRRILYIRLASHEIHINRNIFVETLGSYSNQSATTVVEMSSNNYFNAPVLTDPELTVYDSGNYTTYNPGFINPEAGNFKVTNEELILYEIGDPRWLQ